MAYSHQSVVDCLQFERAFCTTKCPFNFDIRDFAGKLQQGRFNVAYKTYQQAVGFPGIVTALCPEPCRPVCPMKDAGGAISLKLLEKASIQYARNKQPDQYNMPLKEKRVAIIGAGISGLACALRLATKKYQVTVFEKTGRIGGHLHQLLSPEIFIEDIELQFTHESYALHLDTEITSLDDLNFDAVYLATGKNGDDFGVERNHEGAFASSRAGVFMGGSLTGADTMEAIAHGLTATNAIERYLKISAMNQPEEPSGTKLTCEAIRIIPGDAIIPQNGSSFTREEAVEEAKRCLKCTCDACNHYSPLMSYFRKFPKKITEEVEISIHPSSLDGHATVATRLISTCNHCGLCREVCPVNIDTGVFLLESHRAMREMGKMPWAFHEFYLRDMEFSNEMANLTRLPAGYESGRFLFFPGCQLGASDPRLVMESYQFLLKYHPDTALMLHCCGAPAEWAGDGPVHRKAVDRIKDDWIKLGRPTAVFACPTCKLMFQKHLPEIEGTFIYQLIEEKKAVPQNRFKGETFCVFDPCAGRHETELQDTIRRLAAETGIRLESLPMERNMAECCSYGGHVSIAHPPYAEHMVRKAVSRNEHPYITYCSNCRDIFAQSGKKAVHILDLVFGMDSENRRVPTVSERQSNRLLLKNQILGQFWNEEIPMEKPMAELQISSEIKEKLNKSMILESDLAAVIENNEKTGRKIFDPEKNTFTGSHQIGNMTYWVEYRVINDDVIEVINGYCHRMRVEE
jgi:Fe-S oxidoreductase